MNRTIAFPESSWTKRHALRPQGVARQGRETSGRLGV